MIAMKKPLRILSLEDSALHVELVEHILLKGGVICSIARVDTRKDFVDRLRSDPPDLILSDFALPSFDGASALRLAREIVPQIPFVFVTGALGEEVAIETLKSGATDYVLKTRLSRLVPVVERALREAEERRERLRVEDQLRHSNEQLHALSAYLQTVREEERTRIARAVHDELGQKLTGLKFDLSWLATQLPLPRNALARQKIKALSDDVDATIQTVRRIATELRPQILDDLGLVAAIEWQASEFQNRTGVRCNVISRIGDRIWNQDFTTVFFRIFQETLANIIRHARATQIDVCLSEEDGRLVLEVRDNGRGITESEVANTRSIGLIGMRERAALVGGEVSFSGAPAQGTTVRLHVPLPAKSAKS